MPVVGRATFSDVREHSALHLSDMFPLLFTVWLRSHPIWPEFLARWLRLAGIACRVAFWSPRALLLVPRKVTAPDGKPAGRVSMVFGSVSPCLCVACKWHGCKFMVPSHRVPKGAMVEQWLIDGQFQTQEQHESSFFARTGIARPMPRRGRGRGSAS